MNFSFDSIRSNSHGTGYLKIILGPMFSGKTTELVRIYNKYNSGNIKCCVVNHSSDTRYDNSLLSTHDQYKIKSFNCNKLKDIMHFAKEYDVFLINEGQFFDDLVSVVKYLINNCNRCVYVCGLDGDFKREKFGQILDLIPYCDDVIKLKAICKKCKTKEAIFTHRLTNEKKQTVVGNDNYTALCRKCYTISMSSIPIALLTSSSFST
jgi:thymidine kinase